MKKTSSQTIMINIFNNPRYQGKHVIVVKNKVWTAKTGRQANIILDKLERKYPQETPVITFIPKADTLILWL